MTQVTPHPSTKPGQSVPDSVWRLALPIIVSNISVPLLGAVDTAVIGRLPGPEYLGGVQVGALLFSFLYWGFGFLRMSTTGLTAQAYGADQKEEIRAVFLRAGIAALCLALVAITLHLPAKLVAFSMIEASDRVEELGAAYIQYRIYGAPAALLSYGILGWFLGLQDVKTPLFLQIATNGLNILLSIVFVTVFDWGVPGVAAATAVSEWIGAGLGLFLIARRLGALKLGPLDLSGLFDTQVWARLFFVNSDIFIRTLCLIFAFAYFTAAGAAFGDTVLAANAVLLNFITFAAYGLDGFAHAVEALIGKHVGRGEAQGARGAVRAAMGWALALSGLGVVFYFFGGPALIDLLTTLPEVRARAREFLPWAAIMPLVAAGCYILDGVFLGATRTASLRNAMLVSTLAYLFMAFWLAEAFGNHGLWASLTLFMAMRGVTLAIAYPALIRSIGANQRDFNE